MILYVNAIIMIGIHMNTSPYPFDISLRKWVLYQVKRYVSWWREIRRVGYDYECQDCGGYLCDPEVGGTIEDDAEEGKLFECGRCMGSTQIEPAKKKERPKLRLISGGKS